jgi:anti-sigma factor RsiW
MASLSDEDRANLTAYLDGELDEETAHTLEAKISQDPEARAELEALRQAWGMLDYLPRAAPSTTFTHRTMERLSLERRPAVETGRMPVKRPAWPGYLGWAAAVLVAAAAGYWASTALFAPSTPDADEPLVRQLRLIERWRDYETIDDLEFLKSLDHPDLFAEDVGT